MTNLKIEKVVSRGAGADAQVLLVLVSIPGPAAPEDDVWVAIGQERKVRESARLLSTAELEALDPHRSDDTPPFGFEDAAARTYWLARFDFSDHSSLASQWSSMVQAPADPPPEPLNVLAWAADAVPTIRPLVEASESISMSAVVVQPPFELGVLFVHGIGNHRVRETLVRWAEPIVAVWRDRGFELETLVKDAPLEGRLQIGRWVQSHQLRAREPIDGISQVVEEFAPEAHASTVQVPPGKPRSEASTVCCTAARTEQTTFGDSSPGLPSSALLRVSTVDSNAVLRESHVLFSEAYWTRETFPPTWAELRYWLTTAVPIAMWARMERVFVTRPAEIAKYVREANDGFEQFRVVVSIALWLAQLLTVPALYVVGGIAVQLLSGLASFAGLLPIPWLQNGIRTMVTALLGTLGQSFALQNSPIRRAAIVATVTKDLNWLSDRCQRVVILSHSQGAEVTRRVSLDARRHKIERWYTFGAGIAPLNMLHPKAVAAPFAQRLVFLNKVGLTAVGALIAALTLDTIPGLDLGARAFVSSVANRINWPVILFVFSMYAAILFVAVFADLPRLMATMKMRPSLLRKMTDYFASEDPVPAGSFMDRFREVKQFTSDQYRIFNTRTAVLDHTSYWQNVEQFVAPIAIDLLHLLGMGGHEAQEKAAIDRASRRRDIRTWWNMMVWVPALAVCVVSVLLTAFGPAHRGAIWAEEAGVAWSQGSGILKRLQPFLHLVLFILLNFSICRFLVQQ